jgi:MscS family membrane protein
MAWLVAEDFNAFTALRGELLLRIMEIVEQAGTSFAFPTRTVQLVPPPAAAPDRR